VDHRVVVGAGKTSFALRCNRLGKSDPVVSELSLSTMTHGEQNTEAEVHEQLDHA
jgi:aryl-alcohol dehydrogenase-like predicted oxidoreductase